MSEMPWAPEVTEEICEPSLEIIDSHVHLWDEPHPPYLLADLLGDFAAGHRVTRTIYVEDGWGWDLKSELPQFAPVAEVRRVAEVSSGSGRPAGPDVAAIVGHADLRYGDRVGAVLDAMVEAGDRRFVGIRHGTAWDASPEIPLHPHRPGPRLLERPEFRRGFAELAARELTYDAWVFHPQLPEVVALARAFPETSIVVNHLGGPLAIGPYAGRSQDVVRDWKRAILEVKECPNVSVKIGGLVMPPLAGKSDSGPATFTSDEIVARWSEQIRWCVEQFGGGRCMFESNFPVDKQWIGYVPLYNAYKRIVADGSPSEKADLFANTAAKVYKLVTPAAGGQATG
jgi:predicted TIM-barrel fold metal-dependent hydrolase